MNAPGALDELAGLGLWVTWQSETRQGSDKPTKVPYAHTGLKASSINPGTWSTRAIAEHTAKRDNRDGIGIVLAPLGADRHLGGIDLDACIDDEGTVTAWAREIVELLASYTEVSPSGLGLKVFFTHDERETLAEGMHWRSAVRRPALNGGKEPGIEFYLRARYFTVTDATFEQYDTIRAVDSDTLRHVQRLMDAFDQKPKAPTHHPRRHDDDDQQRIIDAIGHIPNPDVHWNDWNRIGMAIFRETGGSAQGYAAFLNWSAKSSKFDPHACDERWQHWHTSPPNRLTAGTIIYEAKAGGWQDPRQRNGGDHRPRLNEEAEAAQREAIALFGNARHPADPRHPYLVTKGIRAHGVRQQGDELLVPRRDMITSEFVGLQRILPDGEKRNLPGGRVDGTWFIIGQPQAHGTILVGEGFAACATGHEDTGHAAVVSFGCDNLEPAAVELRKQYPQARIIVLANDDWKKPGKPGMTAAKAAARGVDGFLAVPTFGDVERTDKDTDFNDLRRLVGADAVRAAIEAAKPVAWDAPEPLISDTEPPPPYPIEALPDLVRHAVEEVQHFTQTPDEMVAISALSALSIATQHIIDVRRTTTLFGPNGLYFLTVADSGDRKTTLDRYFMTPIYKYEQQERETGKATEADHAASMAVWEAKKQAAIAGLESAAKGSKAKDDKAKDGKAKDDKTLEAYQADLADLEKNKPTPPRIPRIIYADATQEKLLRCLATGWPSAAIVSSEGGAVFGAHAMGRDSVMRTLGALNVLWDGGTLQVDRVGGGSFVVRGARLSINIQVQALVLRAFMEGTKGLARGSGFLARFLIAVPETRMGTRMFKEEPASWPALTALNARISALLATKPTTNDDGTLAPTVLDFSHEAKAVWIECHDEIEKAIGPIGEFVDVRDVAAKAADNIARLAALFHFLDKRNGYGNIGPEAVRSAATVVIWHLYQAKAFLGPLASSPEEAQVATLDRWLRAYCRREGVSTVSTRTIQRFGPVRARKALDEALDTLAEAGRIRIVTDGRKRQVAVNPALLEANP